MYIDKLTLTNVRTFVENDLTFVHPDLRFGVKGRPEKSESWSQGIAPVPKPKLPNVNLLLGDNGSGKTTVLQTLALASLGPAARDSQLPLRQFVRFPERGRSVKVASRENATVFACLRLHDQDGRAGALIGSRLSFQKKRELERLEFADEEAQLWQPVYESRNDAFFCVAYGATRRVDTGDSLERGSVPKTHFLRGQRLQSIFQDSFALFPLAYWLPQLKSGNPGRYKQVEQLLNRLLGPGNYRFTGEMDGQEYLFERGGMRVPFRSLSDGYRAFIAWVADLLYHVCYGCPSGQKLTESAGVVLVDEIDLHLHPKWQMKVVATVAKALPRMQFVFSSHSPLIAGSLEWMNIITLKTSARTNRTADKRLRQSIHGLDADQILSTDFFGLETTVAPAKRQQLAQITERIRSGDKSAPLQLIQQMSSGTEAEA